MGLILSCLKVFFARIIDVCLGAFRTVNIVKGNRMLAAIIAFIEVLIWYAIAREVLTPKNISLFIPFAYAGGYATGTYLGTFLSGKFGKGFLTVYVISSLIKKKDIELIKKEGFGVTMLNNKDNKTLLLIQINKKSLEDLRDLIQKLDTNAFIIMNETKYVNNGFIK